MIINHDNCENWSGDIYVVSYKVFEDQHDFYLPDIWCKNTIISVAKALAVCQSKGADVNYLGCWKNSDQYGTD